MKQLLICYKQDRKLVIRNTILTDIFIPVEDVISPQKTALIVPKTDKVELSDIVIVKDNNSGVVEFIGYIDTLSHKVNTEMSCYPLINVLDNEFLLDQMYNSVLKSWYDNQGNLVYAQDKPENYEDVAVDVVSWLETELTKAFIDTEDDLQALPLYIANMTKAPVLFKKALDTANMFEVYTDVFVNTGVYIKFTDLVYDKNEIVGIRCEIRCNKDEAPYQVHEYEPTIKSVRITDNTFTNYNKIIAVEDVGENNYEPQIFYFYLLDNNDITTDAKHPRRIKQVRTKSISFNLADGGEEEQQAIEEEILDLEYEYGRPLTDEEIRDVENTVRARALILAIYNELQAPEYNLQIEIEMIKNDNLSLYRSVDFYAESGIIYTSNVTKIERLNDRYVKITLGALRNSLTDFKKKVEAI